MRRPIPSDATWPAMPPRASADKEALELLAPGEWPAASVITRLFGTWSTARAVAAEQVGEMPTVESAPVSASFGRESIPLPKPRESAAISEVLRGGE